MDVAPGTLPEKETEIPGAGRLPRPAQGTPGAGMGGRARRNIVAALIVAAIAFAGFAGARWVLYRFHHETTDNAYVTGHVHPVSARVAGTVSEVLVADNQAVKSGGILVRLDPDEFAVNLSFAEAQLKQGRALLRKASLDRQRAEKLYSGKIIAPQDLDKATADNDISAGAMQMAEAKVAGAKLQLEYTQIAAPAGGRIGHKSVEVGERVEPGQPLLAVVEDEVWIVANFKETQLARLRPGQAAEIAIDSVPGRKFAGRVESFSPASGAVFALLPPDNATGNFTKIVQRLPVKIVFDPESVRGYEDKIVPGLSVVVSVSTD